MRTVVFVVALSLVTSAASSAIGPEHRLPARFPALVGVGFDGDFIVAYVQRGAADQRGLYLQRVKADSTLAGSPIRLSTTEPDRVQIIGNRNETAIFWRGCDGTGRCGLLVNWVVNGLVIGESSFLGERYSSAAASPRGDGTIFVAGSDSALREIRLATLPPRGTALSESRIVVTEPHDAYLTGAYVGNPSLVSNGREMLLGWTQFYRASIPLFPGSSSHEPRLKVRRLDASGDPVGSVTALPYQLWELATDGDGFLVVGTRYPHRSWFLNRVRSGIVEPGVPYLRGSLYATIAGDGSRLFALDGASFLTVTTNGADTSYVLDADPELASRRALVVRGNDRLLVAYELVAPDHDPSRTRIGYRIIDDQPFPLLPQAPQPRVAIAAGSDPATAQVEWDPVEAATSYRLRIYPADPDGAEVYSEVQRFGPDIRQATVPLPLGDTTYAVDLSVTTAVGTSPPSAPVLVRTQHGTIRMPFNLTAEVGPQRTVTLRWTDPSSRETGFEIRWGWAIETLKSLPPDTTETTLTLPQSGVYALHVVAIDERGHGVSSFPVVVEIAQARGRTVRR